MKIYIDIILSGKNFNPQQVSNDYNIKFRSYRMKGDCNPRTKNIEKEGYAILSSDDNFDIDKQFEEILFQYDKIFKVGEEKIGIDNKEFNLYVETLQNSFSIDTKYLKKICTYFSKINITYIEEEASK